VVLLALKSQEGVHRMSGILNPTSVFPERGHRLSTPVLFHCRVGLKVVESYVPGELVHYHTELSFSRPCSCHLECRISSCVCPADCIGLIVYPNNMSPGSSPPIFSSGNTTCSIQCETGIRQGSKGTPSVTSSDQNDTRLAWSMRLITLQTRRK